ncbi:MAG: tetratricopeptide repeat protein [Pyrinomonadaceae bacterium]|nr:tetratricopeptide repeat protein [Blastocatellia bacterium]MCW5957724.1 tetratricopeptide repeat protein [Pyrinomonadaceae bacterium]
MIRFKVLFISCFALFAGAIAGIGQVATTTTPEPPMLSNVLAAKLRLGSSKRGVSTEVRGKAYAKLLEGQRFIWLAGNIRRSRGQAAYQEYVRAARSAFIAAVEIDPFLAEAYTALAELSLTTPPSDLDEALRLAQLSTSIDKDNFGARRIEARLLTFKSGIANDVLDPVLTQRAIDAWKYIANLDPRNAEAWAFLSEFYGKTGKDEERIESLKKWLASSVPIDSQFYQRVTGGRDSLAPENASIKLSEAFVKAGKITEAIDILSQVITDDPDNGEAVELLRQAIASGKGAHTAAAIQALQIAVFANPDNQSLGTLLAEALRRSGNRTEALRTIRSLRVKTPNDETLARREATILTELGRVDEAVTEYRKHLVERSKFKTESGTGKNGDSTYYSVDLGYTDQFSSLLFISQLYSSAGKGKEAIDSANKAYTAAQGAERKQIARLSLATAQQMAGDHNAAEATLREILKESPGNPIALNNLGYFLLERGEKLDEALKMIKGAYEVDPTNPSYLDSLGWAHFKLGDLTEAEKYLKAAEKIDPMSATLQEHLGDLYKRLGKMSLAAEYWSRSLDLSTDRADIERLKGKLK